MAGKIVYWRPELALSIYRSKLLVACERASVDGAYRAHEFAPLGKGNNQATGSHPRFFALRLQTVHEFNRANRKTQHSITTRHALARLRELRSLNRGDLVSGPFRARPEDVGYFRIKQGSHTGEQPDIIEERPAKGPGGLALRGAVTTYRPGRLKAGIHPIDAKAVSKTRVRAGFASEAPYSWFVEHGFHHKGGTQVEGKHFMSRATEAIREEWNSGAFFKE